MEEGIGVGNPERAPCNSRPLSLFGFEDRRGIFTKLEAEE
jgi:hypothetical protein